jgi:hypothetical protein
MGLFSKPKAPPPVAKVEPVAPQDTPEEIIKREEEKKNKAILALNAGGGSGLGDTSAAAVTKRTLLGG